MSRRVIGRGALSFMSTINTPLQLFRVLVLLLELPLGCTLRIGKTFIAPIHIQTGVSDSAHRCIARMTCLRGGGSNDDFYDILGVARDAPTGEIKRAYRKRSLETHPDRNKSPDANEQFIRLGQAYETLRDPQKRAAYDRTRRWRDSQRQQRHSSQNSKQQQQQQQQDEQWRPPPRPEPEEPYTMDDALKTFRSFFGFAVDTIGESQLDRLLEADSPFATVAKSTWIATSAAYILRPNATAHEREETRRAIDAALLTCMPLLERTIGRRPAARILGYLSLGLTPLALSRYAANVIPVELRRAMVGLSVGVAVWRVCCLDEESRERLVSSVNRAAKASIDLMDRAVGDRKRSKGLMAALAMVLIPLSLANLALLAWRVLGLARLAAGQLPGLMATWSLGAVTAGVLWLAWTMSVPQKAEKPKAGNANGDANAQQDETEE